jgi:hypothetical protein
MILNKVGVVLMYIVDAKGFGEGTEINWNFEAKASDGHGFGADSGCFNACATIKGWSSTADCNKKIYL